MNNKDFAIQLEDRTIDFSVAIINLSSSIDYTIESKVIRSQLTRSGTSVGANYHEANRSRSKSEFKSKIRICESEASETLYWIKVGVRASVINKTKVENLLQETKELLSIFTSIGKKLNQKTKL